MKKPGISPPDEVLTKNCSVCHAEFKTGARTKHRCDPCQEALTARRDKRANERSRAKRRASRVARSEAG
jgi:hypothetical protein